MEPTGTLSGTTCRSRIFETKKTTLLERISLNHITNGTNGSTKARCQIWATNLDIVFEHPGRSTFAASMYVAKRGGTVVSCAATSGFMLEFDNRHFWMRLKRLIGSHFANYKEAWEANRLISKGMIHPVLSQVFPLEGTGEAAYQVHHNMHEGKIGVLCLAPTEGLGVTDTEFRDKLGADLHRFRR